MNRYFPYTARLLVAVSVFLLLVMQIPSQAGGFLAIDTDDSESQVFGFWDLRDRDSFIQVTNLDFSGPAVVHVQLFNVADNCTEYDFYDTYTPGDTFVYDIRTLARNDGNEIFPPVYSDDDYGIIAITVVTAVGGFSTEGDIIANSRIIDSAGYEYRTNLPGVAEDDNHAVGFNFSSISGTPQFADVVGFLLVNTGEGINHAAGQGVEASLINGAGVAAEITLYDQNEQPLSCDLTAFICAEQNNLVSDFIGGGELGINFGINDAIVNSKGRPSLCDGTDPVGHVLVDLVGEISVGIGVSGSQGTNIMIGNHVFVGFTGLNNGSGTGSYDSWFAVEGFHNAHNEICSTTGN